MAYSEGMTDQAMPEPSAYGEEGKIVPELVAAQGMDLAMVLEDAQLDRIATECIEAYNRDKEERADWEEAFDKIMALVKAKRTQKSFPWPGASNVKYPLIMKAALKFGARAYPAIVNGTDVVKAAAVGIDPDGEKRKRGDRVSAFMNYQLLMDMPEWNRDTRRLCYTLPYQGTMFRQVVWDAEYMRPKTTLLSGKEIVVTQTAKDLETVPHFAKEFPLYVHQIKERMRSGRYREIDIGLDGQTDKENQGEQAMLECHCRYDLDGDGYPEPWIAVIHKESEKLLSLKAGFWPMGVKRNAQGRVMNIRRHVEFIKYGFLPDPEGNFYDVGYGQLLLEDNEIINTLLNQLIDAATDQNLGGGFINQGLNIKGGNLDFRRGEWKFVNTAGQDIRQAFYPRPTSQPSAVLFNLVSMIIESAKDVASDTDVMSGNVPANTPATTVLATIEEGMKVFSAIYKDLYTSLSFEFQLIGQYNGAYLPPEAYMNVLDEQADPRADFSAQSKDIIPVADPSMTTNAQKLSRAQFLMQIGAGNPLLDQRQIMRRVLEAASIDDIESLMPEPGPEAQQQQTQQAQMALRAAMADILKNEASATDDTMSARLKFIEGNVKAQEAMIQAAAMRMSLQNMMGMVYGPQAIGPGMGGMAGFPDPAAGAGAVPGAGGPVGPPQAGMAAPAMDTGPAGPFGGGPAQDAPDSLGVPAPVPVGAGQF